MSRRTEVDIISRSPESQITGPAMVAQDSSGDPNPQHTLFCRMIGMPQNIDNEPTPSIWNIFTKRWNTYKGLYPRVRRAYQWHTFQYWLVATASNLLLGLQICFGAALTALGSTKSDRVSIAIIILGALQTVFGGFITYFKSRNQPNRARQFRIGLKRVLDAIEDCEAMLRDPNFIPPSYTPGTLNIGDHGPNGQEGWLGNLAGVTVTGVEGMVLRLMDMYTDATKEAEANYPDFWLKTTRSGDQGQSSLTRELLDELRKGGAIQRVNVTVAGDDASGTSPATSETVGQAGGGNTGHETGSSGGRGGFNLSGNDAV